MIFPSYIFLLAFLPLVLISWYGIRNIQIRLLVLTVASYVFYGWWDYRFTALMLGSTLLDYVCGQRIYHASGARSKRNWLWLSLAGNLGALGFFKYYDFFSESVAEGLQLLNISISDPVLNIVLPIGISFYTFQSMSYSLDIYRDRCKPAPGFLFFAAYVSLFPQLVAGPIVRYAEMEQQLNRLPKKKFQSVVASTGVWLFVIGMIKKLWIADEMAPYAEQLFDSFGDSPDFYEAWLGTFAYTFQLYFDFSAYSDMARGLGMMLGFRFPINFNSPYKSASIAEFWNRWHISLSHWLRDYLFIPLGGSRRGLAITLRNLCIVMFLGGLWHGANWTFVLWGLYHGLLLVINASWRKLVGVQIPRLVAVPITFISVVLGWAMFRANTVAEGFSVIAGLVGLNGIAPPSGIGHLGFIFPRFVQDIPNGTIGFFLLVGLIAFFSPNSQELPKPWHWIFGVALALVLLIMLPQLAKPSPFLYFQF